MNILKIYVVSNMKLFSEYIINEGVENFDNIYTYIFSQIISFAQLSDIINFISDENLSNEYKSIMNKYIGLIVSKKNEITIDTLK